MKRNDLRKWLVLGGLLAFVGLAAADYNVQDKGTYYNNASTGLRTTSSGHLTTQEQDPAMDANLTFASIINNSALAAGAADSSIVLDTHRMRLGTLLFKIVPGTGNPGITRLAVQIRVHLYGSADSSNTFAIYRDLGGDGLARASGAGADTSAGGHYITGSATVAWSGEFVVAANNNRNARGSLLATTPFYYPSGIAVPLQSYYGRDIYAPYISVRIRSIAGPTCAVTVHLVGSPL